MRNLWRCQAPEPSTRFWRKGIVGATTPSWPLAALAAEGADENFGLAARAAEDACGRTQTRLSPLRKAADENFGLAAPAAENAALRGLESTPPALPLQGAWKATGIVAEAALATERLLGTRRADADLGSLRRICALAASRKALARCSCS